MSDRKYEFTWDLIGDIKEGRPNLGTTVDLDMYRIMQFTMRDIIEQNYGTEAADKIFYDAGKMAGTAFYEHFIEPVSTIDEFVKKATMVLREKKIGVLRIEEAQFSEGKVVLTMDEDLDCSGLPELDYETCIYDEGFIAALFEKFTKTGWVAEEVDCWCTGARTCRFEVTKQD